jgi:hypothetical protein
VSSRATAGIASAPGAAPTEIRIKETCGFVPL